MSWNKNHSTTFCRWRKITPSCQWQRSHQWPDWLQGSMPSPMGSDRQPMRLDLLHILRHLKLQARRGDTIRLKTCHRWPDRLQSTMLNSLDLGRQPQQLNVLHSFSRLNHLKFKARRLFHSSERLEPSARQLVHISKHLGPPVQRQNRKRLKIFHWWNQFQGNLMS